MKERGEMSVAVILLLTFFSGLGITFFGVQYDHRLRAEEAAKAQKAVTIQNQVDWERLPDEGEIR